MHGVWRRPWNSCIFRMGQIDHSADLKALILKTLLTWVGPTKHSKRTAEAFKVKHTVRMLPLAIHISFSSKGRSLCHIGTAVSVCLGVISVPVNVKAFQVWDILSFIQSARKTVYSIGNDRIAFFLSVCTLSHALGTRLVRKQPMHKSLEPCHLLLPFYRKRPMIFLLYHADLLTFWLCASRCRRSDSFVRLHSGSI